MLLQKRCAIVPNAKGCDPSHPGSYLDILVRIPNHSGFLQNRAVIPSGPPALRPAQPVHAMKHQLYFPSRQDAQLAWLKQFRHALPLANEILNLPETTVSAALNDLDWLFYVMGPLTTRARAHSQACTATLRLLMNGRGTHPVALPESTPPPPPAGQPPAPGALTRVFKLVQTIKHHGNYTPALGLSLGVVGNLHASDSPVPLFTLKVKRGAQWEVVEGTFSRFGRPGVYIETRRAGGDWEPIGHGLHAGSTFLDARPLLQPTTPEFREYRLRYWEDSAPTGDWTPIATVTVSP
jgi:hypothetical protein